MTAAGAAGGPTRFVPARAGGWPDWLAGPLAGLHLGLPGGRFQTLTLVMCGGYLLVLVGARTVSMRAIAAVIVLTHVLLALGPPLISQDVFGYLAFARMGALHGLDPYTHFPSEAPTDPVFQFLGWPFQHSPYGPAVHARELRHRAARPARAGCGSSKPWPPRPASPPWP